MIKYVIKNNNKDIYINTYYNCHYENSIMCELQKATQFETIEEARYYLEIIQKEKDYYNEFSVYEILVRVNQIIN